MRIIPWVACTFVLVALAGAAQVGKDLHEIGAGDLLGVASALPLQGQETSLVQLEETAGLFPSGDDEATTTSEVQEAIEREVNLAGLHDDIGESMKVSPHASAWERKAAADINAMSRGPISNIHGDENDSLVNKFAADVQEAKARIAGPQKKADKESEIEHQADEALKDPEVAAQLKKNAAAAEVDIETMTVDPFELFQEDEGADDLGEDDDEGDGFQLMAGSDSDVEKAINAQITDQVNQQIGSIPAPSGDADAMTKFEQDKVQAQKFLAGRVAEHKQSASDKIKAQLLAAQKELQEAQNQAIGDDDDDL